MLLLTVIIIITIKLHQYDHCRASVNPKVLYTPSFSLTDLILRSERICENVTVLGE